MAESGHISTTVQIAIDAQGGKVVVQFDRDIGFLRMKPRQAAEFSRALGDKVESITDQNLTYISPVGISVDVQNKDIVIQFDQMVDHLELVPLRAAELCFAVADKVESVYKYKSPIITGIH